MLHNQAKSSERLQIDFRELLLIKVNLKLHSVATVYRTVILQDVGFLCLQLVKFKFMHMPL